MNRLALFLLLLPALALCAAGPALAADKEADERGLPENFRMADDFEDGDLRPVPQGQWFPIDDRRDGGSSLAKLAVRERVEDDEEQGRALHMAYLLGRRFRKKATGEEKSPQVFVGLSLGKQLLEGWQDLSGFTGVSFDFQGEGTYLIVLYTLVDEKPCGHFRSFTGSKEWKRVTCPFEEFVPLESLAKPGLTQRDRPMALRSGFLLALGPGLDGTPGASGRFALDDFGWIERSRKEKLADLQDTEPVLYGNLVFQKPKKHWTFEKDELRSEGKPLAVHFAAFPMHDDWRVPFPGGRFADPANVSQMERCTRAELERRGLANLRRRSEGRASMGQFRSHRFVFDAEAGESIMKHLRPYGASSPDFYVQVDFIKYRSVMYEIITFVHASAIEEQLPVLAWMFQTFRKWKKS